MIIYNCRKNLILKAVFKASIKDFDGNLFPRVKFITSHVDTALSRVKSIFQRVMPHNEVR